MKKCHGGFDTIVAAVVMVVLVIAIIIGSVIGLSREAGNTVHSSVEGITGAQKNIGVVNTEGPTTKIN
ncbi:MAG: hypothetical protein J6M02_04875 [Clostridia bacterium]|nr:hypothetical protein [Clostridia bacterium]